MSLHTMRTILTSISEGRTLTQSEARRAMDLLLDGKAETEEIAGLLLGLRSRGETVEELIGFTSAMRHHAVPVTLPQTDALDIVGTGGDRSGTFNISTATAFVCAGAGATVAKHGSTSVSSKCGASECLDALGIQTRLGKEGVEYCLERVGMSFLFAPVFHPTLKHVMPVRRQLGVRTIFNILGPLCNPANVRRYLMGAFSMEVAELMANILVTMGATHLAVVHAHDGLDEITISGPSTVFLYRPGDEEIQRIMISPFDYGVTPAPLRDIMGGGADQNAGIIRDVLAGKKGAPRDIVTLNAGFALYTAEMADSVVNGIRAAEESIDSGAAQERLARLVEASNEAPGL